jgi:hypothetical protein
MAHRDRAFPAWSAGLAAIVLLIGARASTRTDDPRFVISAVILLVIAAAIGWALRPFRYPSRARRPIADMMIGIGVSAGAVAAWLGKPYNDSQYRRYVASIEEDRGLQLLGLVAMLVRHERVPWREVYDDDAVSG